MNTARAPHAREIAARLTAALWVAVMPVIVLAGGSAPDWKTSRVVQLDGLTVTVSEPVCVARSKGFLWFPTIARVGQQRLVAMMSNKADAHTNEQTGAVAWSTDGGLSWSAPEPAPIYSECPLETKAGLVLLPNYLFQTREKVIGGRYLHCPAGGSGLRIANVPLTVAGWPRPLDPPGVAYQQPQLKMMGFLFNGQCVTSKDGRYLATLYGRFKGVTRYSLVIAESRDGEAWRVVSTVADETCKLPGKEGPCESAMSRLKDGRIMCVFRMESGQPYGRSFSNDEGRTWTEPETLPFGSVQPGLAVMPDGLVALSGGRPGISVWINQAGDAKQWQAVELLPPAAKTSAYTEILAMDEHDVLCVYDQIPHGWAPIPQESPDVNSVWVVRLTVRRGR
jgi:hypothetical protein